MQRSTRAVARTAIRKYAANPDHYAVYEDWPDDAAIDDGIIPNIIEDVARSIVDIIADRLDTWPSVVNHLDRR